MRLLLSFDVRVLPALFTFHFRALPALFTFHYLDSIICAAIVNEDDFKLFGVERQCVDAIHAPFDRVRGVIGGDDKRD